MEKGASEIIDNVTVKVKVKFNKPAMHESIHGC